MKRLLFAAVILMFAVTAFAAEDKCISSGAKSSSAAVSAKPATLCGIRAITNGTNTTTCIVYDNASTNSGTVLGNWTTLGSNYAGGDNLPVGGVIASNGLYVAVTTTGGSCIVYYRGQ